MLVTVLAVTVLAAPVQAGGEPSIDPLKGIVPGPSGGPDDPSTPILNPIEDPGGMSGDNETPSLRINGSLSLTGEEFACTIDDAVLGPAEPAIRQVDPWENVRFNPGLLPDCLVDSAFPDPLPGSDGLPAGTDLMREGSNPRPGIRPGALDDRDATVSRAADSAERVGPALAGPTSLTGGYWVLLVLSVAVLVPAWLLYRRLTRRRLLDHDLRRQMLDLLTDQPGMTAADIADRLSIDYDTARHHLRMLDEFDEIDGDRIESRLRYYPNHGRMTRQDKVLVASLDVETRRSILETLAGHGPTNVSGLSEHVDAGISTVSHHLSQMEESGLLRRERQGGSVEYGLADGILERFVRWI